MAFDLMKKIKKMCKGCIDDDEVCIFIVAAILGFLLCVFLRNNEPFTDFAPFNEGDGGNEALVGNSGSPDTVLGLQAVQKTPDNVPPSLQKDYQMVQQNSQKYTAQNIQNKQGLLQMNNAQFQPFQGWDFHGYAPVDLKLDVRSQVPSNKGPMGPDRPMAAPPQGDPQETGSAQNELKIVLIYASWCGHSKKMLPDFAKIESEFNNKTINGTLVIIEKHTDENKELVKEYGVKGFPTLFSVKNGTRSPLNERTYEGLKSHIESNA
jgi:thiol-disulfide isomerase/thioredoxin